jgi:hypothetical protein
MRSSAWPIWSGGRSFVTPPPRQNAAPKVADDRRRRLHLGSKADARNPRHGCAACIGRSASGRFGRGLKHGSSSDLQSVIRSIIVGSTDVGRHESADLGLGSATKFSSGAKVIDQVRVAHCTAAKRCWPHAMLGKEAFCFCEDARVAHQSDLVGRFRQVQSETSGFAENHACGKYPTCRSPII